MEKIILKFLNYLKDNWIVLCSFVILCTTLFCIYISSSIFQLWDVSYLKYIDFSEVYSFTLDSIGLRRSLFIFMLIVIVISMWIALIFLYSARLEINHSQKQISGLIFTNTTDTAEELLEKSENISRFDFAFVSLFKPHIIIHFIVCITLTYRTLITCNNFVFEYEKNTENYKHYLKTYLTIKDQKEKVCGYVVFSNNNKIIFVECETRKLTSLNQRFVISFTSEAKT